MKYGQLEGKAQVWKLGAVRPLDRVGLYRCWPSFIFERALLLRDMSVP